MDFVRLILVQSFLVGYHDLHFSMNYTLCIIYIDYDPVYNSS